MISRKFKECVADALRDNNLPGWNTDAFAVPDNQIDGCFLFDAFQAPDMNIHQTAVVSYVIADKADVATADRPVVFVQISNKSFQWRNSYYLLLAVYDGKSVFIRKYN